MRYHIGSKIKRTRGLILEAQLKGHRIPFERQKGHLISSQWAKSRCGKNGVSRCVWLARPRSGFVVFTRGGSETERVPRWNKGKSATAARWTFIYRTRRALRSAYNGLRRCMDVRCTLCDVHCGMHKKMTCLAWPTVQLCVCVFWVRWD